MYIGIDIDATRNVNILIQENKTNKNSYNTVRSTAFSYFVFPQQLIVNKFGIIENRKQVFRFSLEKKLKKTRKLGRSVQVFSPEKISKNQKTWKVLQTSFPVF